MRSHGYGTLLHNPEIKELVFEDTQKAAKKCSFLLKCPEHNGKPQILRFELWDTAAEYLCTHAKEGDKIFIHEASPRSFTPNDQPDNHKVVFRIKDFSIETKAGDKNANDSGG